MRAETLARQQEHQHKNAQLAAIWGVRGVHRLALYTCTQGLHKPFKVKRQQEEWVLPQARPKSQLLRKLGVDRLGRGIGREDGLKHAAALSDIACREAGEQASTCNQRASVRQASKQACAITGRAELWAQSRWGSVALLAHSQACKHACAVASCCTERVAAHKQAHMRTCVKWT
eukprot:1146616-Pelagomonas_calceolata.AAC.5